METRRQNKCAKKAAVELAQLLKSSMMALRKQGLFNFLTIVVKGFEDKQITICQAKFTDALYQHV
jgi:hypothetical protein